MKIEKKQGKTDKKTKESKTKTTKRKHRKKSAKPVWFRLSSTARLVHHKSEANLVASGTRRLGFESPSRSFFHLPFFFMNSAPASWSCLMRDIVIALLFFVLSVAQASWRSKASSSGPAQHHPRPGTEKIINTIFFCEMWGSNKNAIFDALSAISTAPQSLLCPISENNAI